MALVPEFTLEFWKREKLWKVSGSGDDCHFVTLLEQQTPNLLPHHPKRFPDHVETPNTRHALAFHSLPCCSLHDLWYNSIPSAAEKGGGHKMYQNSP